MSEHDRIFRYIDEQRDFIIRLCQDIIKIPTENPPGDCTSLANFLKDLLNERGLNFKVYEPKEEKPNIVSSIKRGRGKHLVLNGFN